MFCRAYLAHCQWHLGRPDRALATTREAQALAERLAHPFSLALTLNHAAVLHQLRRERSGACVQAEAAVALCFEQGFAHVLGAAMIIQGWVLAEGGDGKAGLARMREGLAAKRSTGAEINVPYYLALIAEAEGKAGRTAEGRRLLAEALMRVGRTGDRWFEAELHRLEGELLLQPPEADPARAEVSLHRALAVARGQSTKALELRAANSLARLRRDQGRRAEARDLLAPVYGWFTEGFDTPDFMEAKALLDQFA